jgi:hypothetical protein
MKIDFDNLGFKQKTLYRMESTIDVGEIDIEKDCKKKAVLERRKLTVECVKNRTLLFVLGVTSTDDGYVIGLLPIMSNCIMPIHVNSADVDELKISFKEVFDISTIEEDNNED